MSCSCLIACIEERVAGGEELLPELVAKFLWHHTYCLPLFLQGDEFVGSLLPFCTVFQLLSLLNQGALLVGVCLIGLFQGFEIFCFSAEELVARLTEALKNFHVHLLWSESNGLPLCLNVDNLLCVLLPVGKILVWLCYQCLYSLTECCLACEIIFLALAYVVEILLVTLVYDRAGSLEAAPYLLAEVFCDRAYLAIFLMKLLKLVERADCILLIRETLGSLTQTGLGLKILLEVILTSLRVQFQQVVILLHI